MIEHDNIIYIRNINAIGGVETYCYELVKKYKDLDIAVVCKTIAPKQKERLNKFCQVYMHENQQIKCKVLITNWDTSIIEYVNDDAKIYTGLHTDYTDPSQGSVPVDDPRITYIGITEDSKNKFEKITGIKRTILCRNPLTIEEEKKPLILMSASRLTKEKGGDLMLMLANELDKLGAYYIWLMFTTNEYSSSPVWKNENIIHMDNRLDLGCFFKLADWYIQPSRVEGDSYSLKEALYRGTPIVARELPYFKEIDIKDGENALFIDETNVKEVAKKMLKPLKFTFKPIEDGYDKILAKGKSKYQEELKTIVKVRCIKPYTDIELGFKQVKEGDTWETNLVRAKDLIDWNDVIEIIK